MITRGQPEERGPAPRRIVILGGGTAGWVCGAVLARHLCRAGSEVLVVDTADIPSVGVGEASIPSIYGLLDLVGLTDGDLVRHAGATFKYGIEFDGWSQPGDRYMHGFGSVGAPMESVPFFSVWAAAAARFTARDLAPFTPSITAAYRDRFSRTAMRPGRAPAGMYYPLAELSYALHFDASLLARLLREKALAFGARHISRQVARADTGPQGIERLHCTNGDTIEGDFFVDCSGLYGFLSRKALGGAFTNWRAFLPCDSAIVVQTERTAPPRPYTRSVAHRAGWRWEIQLQGRTGNGCVYSAAHMGEDEATGWLMNQLDGRPINTPRRIDFVTGRMDRPWTGNCAAIGLSAGFLEPLESTSIHLICKYAIALAQELGAGRTGQEASDAFNAGWQRETDEIRDFLMMHYTINSRPGAFWQERRSAHLPATLTDRLAQYANTGWIDLPPDALFGHDSWFQILTGQHAAIRLDRLAAPAKDAPILINFLQNIARAVDVEVGRIPLSHQRMIDRLRAEGGSAGSAGGKNPEVRTG